MNPTFETDNELTYAVGGGCSYIITKTDPPVISMVVDHSHPNQSDRPQTWLELKQLFDEV